jgi:ABC-2 type transport system permease protein
MNARRLRTLVRREVNATLRDPFTLGVLIAVPLVALLLFGFILSTKVENMRIGIYDASRSSASRRLIADLAASDSFRPRSFETGEAIERALVRGEIGAGLVIPADFERDLLRATAGGAPPELRVLYDGAEAVLAGNTEAFFGGIARATGAQLVASDVTARRLVASIGTGSPAPGGGVAVVTRALFNPTFEGTPFMVAGTFGFVLSFLTTLLTAVSIVNERQSGTFDQLQLTPASTLEILLGKLLPLGAVFAFDVVLMVLAAGAFMHVWPQGSALLFIAISAFYVVFSLSLGLIFSATSATAAEAVQKTVLSSIPTIQLSGFAFPIRSMPRPLQWVTELIPATHYIRVSRAIYLRGAGVAELLPELAILVLFGAVLLTIALRTLERRA